MNSAKSTSVWLLYLAPPSSAGLTNGVRSVEARKSANHSSAVAVRRADVASITRARAATRSRSTFATAIADGSLSPQRSMSAPSSAPPRPIASTLAAMVSAVVLRARAPGPSACPLSGRAARHLPPSVLVGAWPAGGVRGWLRAAVASSACARLCRRSPPHTALPHKGGGEGMPA
eukprot:3574423-Pleurochrysis_carterae.AAC.1